MGKLPEQLLNDRFRKGLKKVRVMLQRHEDYLSVGIPDFSYDIEGMAGSGWIEMKRKKSWPVRPTTPLRLKHFTKEQKAWLYKHGHFNKRCWLFLQVEQEYFLFDYKHCQEVGNLTKWDMWAACIGYWPNQIDWVALRSILKGGALG
jgi:hypothetical protein